MLPGQAAQSANREVRGVPALHSVLQNYEGCLCAAREGSWSLAMAGLRVRPRVGLIFKGESPDTAHARYLATSRAGRKAGAVGISTRGADFQAETWGRVRRPPARKDSTPQG